MIIWPPTLIREVAARRCVFFLGAGVSASATDGQGNHPQTWAEFLGEACQLIIKKPQQKLVQKLIKERKYLLALQGIRDAVDPAEYRALLNRHFNNPAYKPSALHECIYQLDARLVITTNFDRIYERYCLNTANLEAYKIMPYYSTDLIDEIRSDTRLIIKAHGGIDDISQMIFTRAEYHRAKSKHASFYDILRAIFLTHTVVFIGCSLEDPDVALLLEEVKITGPSERPHYAIIRREAQSVLIVADWRKTYNIRALEYGPSHAHLAEDLQQLVERVDAERATTST